MSSDRAASQQGYRHEWALFVDWCVAVEANPLPASSALLAEFLGDNPASESVQRRRVSAINRRHLDAGRCPPGTATSIRLALDRVRAARTAHRATVDFSLAAALPTSGSVASLFGRRDAVLLLLAGAGLSHTAIATLDRSDVVADHGDLWVGGVHCVRVAALGPPAQFRPVDVWERWHTVLRFSDRYPSTRLVLDRLRDNVFPDLHSFPSSTGPVAVPIDRWGHVPFPATAMTPAAVAAVLEAHRGGHPPPHTPPPREHRIPGRADIENTSTVGADEHVSVTLDPGYYRAGIEARRRDHAILAGVSTLADDVEARIEQLLHRTLDLLGDTGSDDAR